MNFSDKHFWPPGGSKLPDTQATPHLQLFFLFNSNMDQKTVCIIYSSSKRRLQNLSKSAGLVTTAMIHYTFWIY